MKKLIQAIYPNTFLYFSLAFSVLLVVIRVSVSNHFHFVFLLWNLFLAFLPLVFSQLLVHTKPKNIFVVFGLLVSWLLFFPNAPYMVTDLFHLRLREDIPYWFDLLMLFSFAWNGVLLSFLSLLNIEQYLTDKIGVHFTRISIFVILFLCSFGIYLGRYLRWNSWDIIQNPNSLWSDIYDRIRFPMEHTTTYGVTIMYGLFLFLAYYSIKWLPKQIVQNIPVENRNNVVN